MAVISTVANYGGKICDYQTNIKQFIESPSNNALLIYKNIDGVVYQTLANNKIPLLVNNLTIKQDLIVDGSIYNPSDKRLKKNIDTLSLEKINNLNKLEPISYKYINDIKEKLHYGLLADDVEKLYPELIENTNNGYKKLNYLELIPLLLSKINNMDEEIKELKAKILDK
jgi:hypothetical protein